MRKLIATVLMLALFGSLIGGVCAAEGGISLSDGKGMPGDTVYLAVKLSGAAYGSSIGISYSYDLSVLEATPEACSWSVQGVLQDFDDQNRGVWAADQAKDLNGTICVLALRIRPGAKFTETAVSCTVAIQNGEEEVGNFTAQATVSRDCNHEYGSWNDGDSVGHIRECVLCQGKQTQSHSWDDGKFRINPDSMQTDWKVYTCTVCGGEKLIDVPKTNEKPEDTKPTEPVQTLPTLSTAPKDPEEETRPSYTQPTQPDWGKDPEQNGHQEQPGQTSTAGNSVHDYNDGPKPTDEHGHIYTPNGDGSGEYAEEYGEQTLPLMVQSNQSEEEHGDIHDHDHAETVQPMSQKQQRWNLLLVFVLIGALAGAGTCFLKKKR